MRVKVLIPSIKEPAEISEQVKTILETTGFEADVIPVCSRGSAAENRNRALDALTEKDNIFIMMDDDIDGFYEGWHVDLLKPLIENESVIISSARLRGPGGQFQNAMGMDYMSMVPLLQVAHGHKVTTACIAVRKNPVRFDEGFIGSGFEDTDYSKQIMKLFPEKQIIVNNGCVLTHLNEAKNQGGEIWKKNRAHYLSKWPEDAEIV